MNSVHCPVVAQLDAWSNLEWRDGLQVDKLDDLETLLVETRNSRYEIIVLDARKSEVLVRGGRFFPVYTPAVLSGASLGGSFLKLHGIYKGFSMELYTGEDTIITSSVRQLSVVKEPRLPS